eukprot:CAMPEP_0206443888 /NCGR_PEP_ID=MMETSP0324_2-20121206/14616_1 /ASSEMBLY_ACC=CAM_ASM_000836 /TAXON_ID=2866 /ORGANISM="Crypthecodinium cohnii, Strain Seligo" /LENGTH=176 /DNA_ID=CAMNT_0053911869 /DNA_START=86 /DNA_END=614 /DNA_ORIENTATION=-
MATPGSNASGAAMSDSSVRQEMGGCSSIGAAVAADAAAADSDPFHQEDDPVWTKSGHLDGRTDHKSRQKELRGVKTALPDNGQAQNSGDWQTRALTISQQSLSINKDTCNFYKPASQIWMDPLQLGLGLQLQGGLQQLGVRGLVDTELQGLDEVQGSRVGRVDVGPDLGGALGLGH